MQTIRSIKKMQLASRMLSAKSKTIGLVPTMGFLHEGHLSLIRRAKKAADVVIVTIFVNPTQFAPNEDLDKYPRDEKGDIKKIKQAGGDIVFIPKASDIYPIDFQTYVTVEKLTKGLESSARPTHFRGVTTIVAKLFNITRPDVAVFGMKDFQQAQVLKQMTRDLGWPIKLIVAPTLREKDGLAMSSRNKYLTDQKRTEARCLIYALRSAKAMVASGAVDTKKIRREMRAAIKATCVGAKVDYIAFTDAATLRPLSKVTKGTVCSLAVKVHGVRLIDNMKL
ncbi:MAG: pantoate--beta-alanine ligase [candidate division Zixibacteria bacterium]|nr:pantoate--beta-alanine ligase [candidate division Zixibacteria bacterium]MDH3938624.1 pantoate--beta-alanine ligase [candidate division Zixibacteria bacterium]MDH4032812.1 pantoate--beta-alanine ligase [candidate division Zixibacteria bacterium]